MARRTRQYPMDFGRASIYVETIDDPDLEELSQRTVEAIEYEGLVEIEYKRDPRTGRLNLLDINARVWGWHSIGRRAGVDFPYLQWQILHGEAVGECKARPGVRWVRGSTDLPTAIKEIRRGNMSLRANLGSLRGPVEFAILARDGPMPAIVEIPLIARLIWKRRAI
jgi:predicted ATP-grasp superfamily ATP-dependent carboligase